MAARKIRQPPAEQSPIPPAAAPTADAAAPAPPPASVEEEGTGFLAHRRWFWAAVLLFALWFVFLATLALRTANPVTLNRAQIRIADLVVEASVEKLETGECRVVQSWPEAPQLEPVIIVEGLADLSIRPGQTYLLPLQRSDRNGGFRVARAPAAMSKPLIYPADDESRRQLEEILDSPEPAQPAAGT